MLLRIMILILICLLITVGQWAGPFEKAAAAEMMIIPALGDNYIYVIQQDNHAIVIDPGDAQPVLKALDKANLVATHILNTHHHLDHVGGNQRIKSLTGCAVIGPDDPRIPALDTPVREGEEFTIGQLTFQVIGVPGHTTTHLAFYVPEKQWVFSGDSLFTGGCGRIFEGTPAQMLSSLRKLMQLPGNTLIFCGHEYTLKNLQFAASLEPDNSDIRSRLERVSMLRQKGEITVPEILATELKTNPFLRVDQPELKKALKMENTTDIEVFTAIRSMKDRF
ncbi:MAG: hydroxyacylglutathione hydrolase [Waddliaceae bacterium]